VIRYLTALVMFIAAYGCLLAATMTDVMERLIPNRLVLAIVLSALVMRLSISPSLVWVSLIILAATAVLLGLLANRDLFGWGDVKLIAAVTLLFAPAAAVPLILAIAIAGGVLACCTLAARWVLREVQPPAVPRHGLAAVFDRETARIRAHEPMPYAVAVLGGVVWQTVTEVMRCWPATSCWL